MPFALSAAAGVWSWICSSIKASSFAISSVAEQPKASARSQNDLTERLRLPFATSPRCWRLIPLSKASFFFVKEVAPCICAKSSISAFRMTSMSYRILQFYESASNIVQTLVSIISRIFDSVRYNHNQKSTLWQSAFISCFYSSCLFLD